MAKQREWTEQAEDEFVEVVAQHKGLFGEPTVNLEMRDGKLWEIGGTWRDYQKKMNPKPESEWSWLGFILKGGG